MPPAALVEHMNQLALDEDFQEVNAYIMTCSRSANRLLVYIRADFEYTSHILKRDAFDDVFHCLDKYRRHFRSMQEDPRVIEEIAWRLLHTRYWQAYYTYYGRQLPSREDFHHRYFEVLPGRRAPQTHPGDKSKFYAVVPGFVYFIQAQGCSPVKIGRSERPLSRLEMLETGSPYPLSLLRQIQSADAAGLERMLHARYDDYNVHGEWFDLPDDVLAALLEEEFV